MTDCRLSLYSRRSRHIWFRRKNSNRADAIDVSAEASRRIAPAASSGRAMLAPTLLSEVQAKAAPTPPLCKGRWLEQSESRRDCLLRFAVQKRSLSQLSLTAPFAQGSQCLTTLVRCRYCFVGITVTERPQKMYRYYLKALCPHGNG